MGSQLFDISKDAPNSVESEHYILACLLNDKEVLTIIDMCEPFYFYYKFNQTVFETCRKLFIKSIKINTTVVLEELKKLKTNLDSNDIKNIYTLTTNWINCRQLETHLGVLKQKYLQRQLQQIGSYLYREARAEGDPYSLLEKSQSELLNLTKKRKEKEESQAAKITKNVLQALEEGDKDLSGCISLGFDNLDEKLDKLYPGDIMTIAAKPGMGKTTFMTNIMNSLANKAIPSLCFSLEMPKEKVVLKLLSIDTGIGLSHIKNMKSKGLSEEDIKKIVESKRVQDEGLPVYIEDDPNTTLLDMRTTIIRYVELYDIKVIFLDYLQTMQGDKKDTRFLRVSNNIQGIKNLCREFGLIGIVLSQITPVKDIKSGRALRPELEHLRDSGDIGQIASVVLFLHTEEDEDLRDMPIKAYIAKNREGEKGTIDMVFHKINCTFEEI